MFLLLALVLLVFLPSPWRLVGFLAGLVLFAGEVAYWQRRVRGRKVQTGVENLVGSVGEVTEPLTPLGQVRVLGELWQARAPDELPRGTAVRVLKVEGLTLAVEQVERGAGSTRD
jgi:membrane protein implicated in regulation of membrane protease activity